jgi:hypothetical protein
MEILTPTRDPEKKIGANLREALKITFTKELAYTRLKP